jgi:hypothetical protein
MSTITETRKELLKNLQPGDEVFWTDPDDGISSGTYKVTGVNSDGEEVTEDTIITLRNDQGSEVEALAHELT